MSILFQLVTVLPVTLTLFIIISFFCFYINCSPEQHADSVNIRQYLRKYNWFYYINVTTFHLAVIMMILFWQDRLPLYAHLCVYIFILMKGYPVMTLITFDPQSPLKNRRQQKPSPKFMFFYSWIYYFSVSMIAFSFFYMSLNP
ncbi:hypothetical protein ECRG_05123 [Escherichia coli H617]|nr:hypothetical protein AML38_25275 [Escherichia coli]KYW75249.1 hypothetical protein AML88_23815 [Escherichia coli]OSL21392.1 hypothetical protein ECRG_05123 [Escherichia coli H617]